MAKLLVAGAAADYQFWPNVMENDGAGDIQAITPTSLRYEGNSGHIITLVGTGFSVVGGAPRAGKVTSVIIRDASNTITLLSITKLKADFQQVFATLFGWNTDEGNKNPDAFGAMMVLLGGKDKLTGSSGADDIGGYSPGNDKVDGKAGDDNINGDAGADKMNGGAGWDQLNYVQSFFDPTATKGIKLDATKGKVIDPWGNLDLIKNFETYKGSGFADSMKGSKADESFRGLRGADKIDGKGGFDEVDYSDDHGMGGTRGVNVNLATGKAADGWGNIDKLKNIEGVRGTKHADVIKGDNKDNVLKGEDGNDTLTGNDGADTFVFNQPPDNATNHDTITDFDASEGDRIALRGDAFPEIASPVDGPLNASEFVANAGGNPTSAAHRIVYDTTNGNLYYDPDGNASSGDQILIAKLTGAPSLTAGAFEIWS